MPKLSGCVASSSNLTEQLLTLAEGAAIPRELYRISTGEKANFWCTLLLWTKADGTTTIPPVVIHQEAVLDPYERRVSVCYTMPTTATWCRSVLERSRVGAPASRPSSVRTVRVAMSYTSPERNACNLFTIPGNALVTSPASMARPAFLVGALTFG